ncbi:RNA-directed DNA polymerase [Janthinobacterium sp. SUN176]|uniref:antiviral reverse transcriptase Drt4 n=1 Tax=Janthinobacterium sp. SUN176 TaxID=3014788 RepID=UPI00271374F9|nr:antiviral reverse transcriptase Drt4 [Janthinobacterium sp. SUN176]MDO8072966.1 RNA-directed DNA polymerase [Janthinobacterium sp. SUN176]
MLSMLSMLSGRIVPPITEQRHIYEALTRHNYFPNQKSVSEIPPCFSSINFTPEICSLLSKIPEPVIRKKIGYDLVEYSSTRHNNIPRTLSLIHPKAYSLLVEKIHENWDEIKYIKLNENSMIKPDRHEDGRMVIMNYEDPEKKILRSLEDGFGCKYRAHTDISGCFNSIYTHSIPWAVIGFDESKKKLENRGPNHWSDDIDMFQRKTKRGETQGIPIGPATSTIIVEIILGKIDEELKNKGYVFRRYIDDYTCFCKTYEDAEKFISELNSTLMKFKMQLNLHKTSIVELPRPLNDGWVSSLISALPTKFTAENNSKRKLTSEEVTHFLDFAIDINKHTADGAVMKFAIGLLIYSVEKSSAQVLFNYIINLAWHFPMLLNFLDTLIDNHDLDITGLEKKINLIAVENSEKKRSDGMAWSLHILKKNDLELYEDTAKKIIQSNDCIAICTLLPFGTHDHDIVIFANTIIEKSAYDKDQYWLLLYQLFTKKLIENPYQGDECFNKLKEHNVNFMPDKSDYTKAEKYSNDVANNLFGNLNSDNEEIPQPTYEEWLITEENK